MKFRRPTSNGRNGFARAFLAGALLHSLLHLAAPPAHATPCIDYQDYLRPIALGYLELPFPLHGCNGAAVVADIVYVPAMGELLSGDLILYEVSDPAAPFVLKTVSFPVSSGRAPTNITIHGSTAFITVGSADHSFGAGEIAVLDLQDPQNPAYLLTVGLATKAFDLAVHDDYAYVACAGGRFAILDVSPPQATSLLTTISTGGGDVRGITVLGGVLHVAAGTKGLRSYSLANPELPVLLDTLPLPVGETAVDVAHDGSADRLVVSIHETTHPFGPEGRIDLFDVSTPSNLQLLGSADLVGIADHLVVRENHAFVAVNEAGVETIDISDAQNPSRSGVSNLGPSEGSGLATLTSGTSLFLTQEGNHKVLDISNPATPSLQALGVDGILLGADGSRLFVGVGFSTVQIRDANSVPSLPVIGSVDLSSRPWGVDAEGDLAIAWAWPDMTGYLDVLDLSNPANPQMSTLIVETGIIDADLEGSVACLVESYGNDVGFEYAMRVVDVSDPSSPQSAFSLPIAYSGVELRNGYAYFVKYQAIDIYDVSNPGSTFLVQTMSTSSYPSIKIIDELLFASTGGKVDIYSLDNPTAPVLIGSTFAPTFSIVEAVLGKVGYAAGPSGLNILDLSDPAAPLYLGSLATVEFCYGVAPAAGEVFVGVGEEIFIVPPQCQTSGTGIADISSASGEIRLIASPNPFRAETTLHYLLPRPATARLTIHDVAGRLVRELVRGPRDMGPHAIHWDGRDEHGTQVSAGVYYVRLDAAGAEHTRNVVRLR
jgi:hypothetical protein